MKYQAPKQVISLKETAQASVGVVQCKLTLPVPSYYNGSRSCYSSSVFLSS